MHNFLEAALILYIPFLSGITLFLLLIRLIEVHDDDEANKVIKRWRKNYLLLVGCWFVFPVGFKIYYKVTDPKLNEKTFLVYDYGKIIALQGTTQQECTKHHRIDHDVFFKTENGNLRFPNRMKVTIGDKIQYFCKVHSSNFEFGFLVNEDQFYDCEKIDFWRDNDKWQKTFEKYKVQILK